MEVYPSRIFHALVKKEGDAIIYVIHDETNQYTTRNGIRNYQIKRWIYPISLANIPGNTSFDIYNIPPNNFHIFNNDIISSRFGYRYYNYYCLDIDEYNIDSPRFLLERYCYKFKCCQMCQANNIQSLAVNLDEIQQRRQGQDQDQLREIQENPRLIQELEQQLTVERQLQQQLRQQQQQLRHQQQEQLRRQVAFNIFDNPRQLPQPPRAVQVARLPRPPRAYEARRPRRGVIIEHIVDNVGNVEESLENRMVNLAIQENQEVEDIRFERENQPPIMSPDEIQQLLNEEEPSPEEVIDSACYVCQENIKKSDFGNIVIPCKCSGSDGIFHKQCYEGLYNTTRPDRNGQKICTVCKEEFHPINDELFAITGEILLREYKDIFT